MASRKRTLLVIDDDASLRDMLTWGFEDLDYHVLKAGTLAEAMIKIDQHRVDYVVLDHHLPDGHGFAFGITLLESNPGIKVMLSSADPAIAGIASACQSMESGRYSFAAKPLVPGRAGEWFSAD